MKVNPSVVIGLGSSGACVISHMERLLYEVINDSKLDLIELISLDTDTTRKEDEAPPGGRRSQVKYIYEANTGQAYRDLKESLGEDFDWCPERIQITGAGAGNLRVGGRLMLFRHFHEVWTEIQHATRRVRDAAGKVDTEQMLQAEMERRRLDVKGPFVDATNPVVYVVGTLAGGTCSGICVDLGYAIRDASPVAHRVGIFFVPEPTCGTVFQENTWAALRDLEYFCEHPNHYNAVWPSAGRAKRRYDTAENPARPYDFVYLVSSLDEHGQVRLPYSTSPDSPLIQMTAMRLVSDLMGLHQLRSARLSNINQHIGNDQPEGTAAKRQFFLNFSLRAVSYPKYEISEAAACRGIADKICATWTSDQACASPTGPQPIREEDERRGGRVLWAEQFPSVWRGVGAAVNLSPWVEKISTGNSANSEDDLIFQFTRPEQGTIFSQIAQQLASRRVELQRLIRLGVGRRLQQSQNLTCAERCLDGVEGSIDRMMRFWRTLGAPVSGDHSDWVASARDLVQAFLRKKSAIGASALNVKRDLVRDELQEILTRLQMYLMREPLQQTIDWLKKDLRPWLRELRSALNSISEKASSRESVILNRLRNANVPILKLSRSRELGFQEEIAALAGETQSPHEILFNVSEAGDMTGLFAIRVPREPLQSDESILLKLKSYVQPDLLRKLELRGVVDIAEEIRRQDRVAQTVNFCRDAIALSIDTKFTLVKDFTKVPAFLLARTESTARSVDELLRASSSNLPHMMEPRALPMFDHMTIFYLEAANFEPDLLEYARAFREAYEKKRKDQAQNIDPLRHMKKNLSEVAGNV